MHLGPTVAKIKVGQVIRGHTVYIEYGYWNYGNEINYETLKSSKQVIVNKVKAYYKKIKIKQNSTSFPYLVMVPKFHKDPVLFRAITCGFGSYLENGNNFFLKLLKEIFDEVQKVTPAYIIKNSFELIKG